MDEESRQGEAEREQRRALLAMLEDLEKSRAKIEHARQQWTAVFDAVRDAIFIHDGDHRIVRANRAYAERAGMDVHELIGKPYWQVFPKGSGPLPCCRHAKQEAEEAEEEAEMKLEGGEIFRSRSFAIHSEEGAYQYSVHILEDITEKRRAEAERCLLTEAIRQAAEAIVVVNAAGRISFINPAFSRLFGYPPEEIIGESTTILAAPGAETVQPAEALRIVREQGGFQGEALRRTRDGAVIPVYSNVAALYGAEGGFEGFVTAITDLRPIREAQQKLVESEARFRRVAETVPDILYEALPPDFETVYASPALLTLTGFEPSEFVDEPDRWMRQIHADDRERVSAELRRALEEGAPAFAVEYRLWHKDGQTLLWFEDHATIERDPQGRPLRVFGVMSDITKRKQAEEALRVRAQLLDSASDSIFVLDFDGNFIYLNEAAWKTRGYTRDEMMGMNLHMLDTPRYEKLIESRMRDVMEKGQCTFESEHRRKDDSVMSIEVNARLIESGGQKRVLSVIRDIRDRKQAEEALRESEEKYRSIYENTQVGIYRTRASDGKLMMANDAMAKMFGFGSAEEATTKYVTSEHYVDPGTRERLLNVLQKNGKFDNFEACLTRNDGIARWYQYSGRLVQGKGYIEGVAADITERKQAEEALHKTNRALKVLSACNETLVHADEEGKLLQDMCGLIVEKGGYPLAWIGFAQNDEAKTIKSVAHAGIEEGYLESLHLTWADAERGRGPAGRAIRSGEPEVAQNIRMEPAFEPWRKEAMARGYASCAALPLRENGKVLGTLNIYAAEEDAFHPEEVKLLQELADDISFGIHTLRLRTSRERLQQENLLAAGHLRDALTGTIAAVALTVEKRDPYTAGHQQRVAQLAVAIAGELGIDDEQIEGIRLGALIHDIGKIYVPAEILSRPGKLTAMEFEIIKMHPQVGYDIIKDVRFPWPVGEMILQHHERLDGSGYPLGLQGDAIIPEARILAVADVVEAMTSHRPYRPAMGPSAALQAIADGRGARFDAAAVDACIRLLHEHGFAFPPHEADNG